jgi:hypothetical protein
VADSADTPPVSVSGSNPLPPVNPSREPRGDASRLDRSNKDRKGRQEEDPRQQSNAKRQKGSDSIQLSDDARTAPHDAAAQLTPRPNTPPVKRLDLNA